MAVLTMPAPDFAAVAWKVDHVRSRLDGAYEPPVEWWDAIAADLRRLGGLN